MAWRGADRASRLERPAEEPPAASFPPAAVGVLVAVADAFAYSSGLAAAVGGGLTLAVGLALGSESAWPAAALVGSGVLFIYGVDRLRDIEGDRASSPMRTDFVVRHRLGLGLTCLVAGLGVTGLLVSAPTRVIALCAGLGSVGLLHRRLKQSVTWKVGYVAAAWTVACVGIPWLGGAAVRDGPSAVWASLSIASGLVANLIASNLREGKASRGPEHRPPQSAVLAVRWAAIATAAVALAVALAAPGSIAVLAWIPAAEAVALTLFRPTERFGHFVVDGTLLVGAILACLHGAWVQ